MSSLEQALDYIERDNIAGFFAFIEKHILPTDRQNRFSFSQLSNTYSIEGIGVHMHGRLETFARKVFKAQLPTLNSHFLTPFVPPSQFVGRQDELKTLHAHLQAGLPTVLVNGLGGIGKTTLARQYVFEYQMQYDHIVWLEQSSTLLNAFIFEEGLTKGLDLENKNERYRFEAVIEVLANTKGNNLLVVDNYARKEEDTTNKILAYLRDKSLHHWRMLFTSREQLASFEVMRLGVLPQDKAVELFLLYAGKKPIDRTELHTLLELIGYHTLMIELLAKNYAMSMDLESVQDLTQILFAKEINNILLQELIRIGANEDEIKLYHHLVQIFSTQTLPDDALHLLRQFAVLPALPIKGTQLLDWIGDKKRIYKPILRTLTEKGLLMTENNLVYEMHRIIQMVMLKVLQPTIVDCKNLYDSLMDLLSPKKVEANPLAHQWLLEYGEALLAGIHFKEELIQQANLQERLAYLYDMLGIYTQAEKLYVNVLHLKKEVLGTKHQDYAMALNNLAGLYNIQGKYEEIEPLYQEALQIIKETLSVKHEKYAITLNNLASLYYAQGEYEKIEPLYQEALQIIKETIGVKNSNYAMSLNNLALLYDVQGKYTEAEALYQQALQIDKETVGTQHPNYATHLNNLARLYSYEGNYAKSEVLYQEVLQITKKILGTQHPEYAIRLYNLGSIYYNVERYIEAKALLTEAYTIQVATLGEQHPDTQRTKKWLDAVEEKL